ncbi:MAG TPA: hypothetical protein VMU50_18145 [Polyangia bacterium]|nr:hypothetical protein [Polyangia bacterium]
MKTNSLVVLAAGSMLMGLGLGCSSSSSSSSNSSDGGGGGGGGDAGSGNAQTPPIGAAAIAPWLQQGLYKTWHCETAAHTARPPSPHNVDRVCSNDVIANNATSTAPWPAGAAAVKELYAQTTDTTPSGWAVYLKTAADSANGANWYYYGALTAGGANVDGMGSDPIVMPTCTSCHLAAGSDAAHTPSTGGHDLVYTPVH